MEWAYRVWCGALQPGKEKRVYRRCLIILHTADTRTDSCVEPGLHWQSSWTESIGCLFKWLLWFILCCNNAKSYTTAKPVSFPWSVLRLFICGFSSRVCGLWKTPQECESYLLVFGSTDMGSIGVSTSTRNITKFTSELVLSIAGQRSSTATTATAALRNLQRCFLLLVLLAFKVLLVSLMQSELEGHRLFIRQNTNQHSHKRLHKCFINVALLQLKL